MRIFDNLFRSDNQLSSTLWSRLIERSIDSIDKANDVNDLYRELVTCRARIVVAIDQSDRTDIITKDIIYKYQQFIEQLIDYLASTVGNIILNSGCTAEMIQQVIDQKFDNIKHTICDQLSMYRA